QDAELVDFVESKRVNPRTADGGRGVKGGPHPEGKGQKARAAVGGALSQVVTASRPRSFGAGLARKNPWTALISMACCASEISGCASVPAKRTGANTLMPG